MCVMRASTTHMGCTLGSGTLCAVEWRAWCTGGPPASPGCYVTPAACGPPQSRWGSRRPGSPGEQCATPGPRPRRSSGRCWCTGYGLWRRSSQWRRRCTLHRGKARRAVLGSSLCRRPSGPACQCVNKLARIEQLRSDSESDLQGGAYILYVCCRHSLLGLHWPVNKVQKKPI